MTAGGYTLSHDKLCDGGREHVFQLHGIHPRTHSNPAEYLIGTPINDALESRVLGKGKSDGIILTRKIDDQTCERREWQLLQFDDNNNAFPSNNIEGCLMKRMESSTDIEKHTVTMVATGDGCSNGNRALGGFGIKPLGNGHLKINEAPILEKEGAFRKWLKMDEDEILDFRTAFVEYLASYVGHQFSKENIKNIQNDLLNQTTAVGTGNVLKPYEITQDANLRVIFSKGVDGTVKSYRGARVHEVGFVYAVGSGGSFGIYNETKNKYFHQGAEIAWGFYVIENVFKDEEVDEDKNSLIF